MNNLQFDTPVLLAARISVVVGNRLKLAIALVGQAVLVDAVFDEVVVDRLGTLLGELLVVLLGADAVGVAADLDFDLRVLDKPVDDLVEIALGLRTDVELIELEQGVGEIPHRLLNLHGDFLDDRDGVADDNRVGDGVTDNDGVLDGVTDDDSVLDGVTDIDDLGHSVGLRKDRNHRSDSGDLTEGELQLETGRERVGIGKRLERLILIPAVIIAVGRGAVFIRFRSAIWSVLGVEN